MTFDATTAASGVDVPNDAAITVTIPDSVGAWYVLDPSKTAATATAADYKSAGDTFTIAAGAADVDHTTALDDKYYSVEMNTFAGANVGDVDFTATGEAKKFMKDGTFTITIASTAGGTTNATVSATVAADAGVTTDVTDAEQYANGATVGANAEKTITVTPDFSSATGKDVKLTLTLS